MNKKILKIKLELIITLFIILLIIIYQFTRSDLTNFKFAEKYICNDLLNINTSTFYVLLLLIFCEGITIFNKLRGKTINKRNDYILKTIILIFLFFFFILQLVITYKSTIKVNCIINGSSMEPTIHDNDKVCVNFSKKIKHQDIIIFKVDPDKLILKSNYTTNSYFIKRVIGLPGDAVKWINKSLYINDQLISESYIHKNLSTTTDFDGNFFYKENGEILYTTIIPEGYCLRMQVMIREKLDLFQFH